MRRPSPGGCELTDRGGEGGRILVVCGLVREAEIARADGVLAVAGGGEAHVLGREIAHAFAEDGGRIRAVLSFGLAGALSPRLRVGDLLLPDAVLGPDGRRHPVDGAWRSRLALHLPGAKGGLLAGSDVLAATPAQKAALAGASEALALDMESHHAAAAAAARGLPFAVLRAVSDGADAGLPSAAVAGMGPGGRIAVGRVLRALARRPGELPALIRTGRDAGRGFEALLRGRRRLGPTLGFADV